MAQPFTDTFISSDAQVTRITEAVLRNTPPSEGYSLLDVGCGAGDTIFALARALLLTSFTGVDISAPNIEHASRRAMGLDLSTKGAFECSDYMDMPPIGADIVVSGSTLHLIPAKPADIIGKISEDVAPGGLLVITLPTQCIYNTLLMTARRIFRKLRSPWTDKFILGMGRLLTRGRYDVEFLRQRIEYMYVIPGILDGPDFRRQCLKRGLTVIEERPEPHASFVQPKHNMIVFRKELL